MKRGSRCMWVAAFIGTGFLSAGGQVFNGPVAARIMMARPGGAPAAPGSTVNLPYYLNDNKGNRWMIYQYGWFQQQGNQQLYSQAGQLMINGNQPQMNNNMGKIDEKTGELVLENMQGQNNLTVTRRILIDKDEGSIRYIDVFHNSQGQDQTVNVQLQSNMNYGIQAAQMIEDPKRKGQNLGWTTQTPVGQCIAEMYGGKGAKTVPTLTWPQGNSYVTAAMSLTIPAGKDVALLHLHTLVGSTDAASKWMTSMKESKMMMTIPAPLRKIIVNFSGGQNFIGDYEILRGELFDVVELRSGDQYKGTLKEKSYKIETFYGTVELPVDKVIGLINVGDFKPRQLIVTSDGQIFGGKLAKDTLALELASGQVTQVPLSQINRMGYRKRAGEPEEWVFDKPLVLLRTGDRIAVQLPAGDLTVHTRYGDLKIKPDSVGAVIFQNEDSAVHQICLTDGSKFAGLVAADQFDMKLAGTPEQAVKIPTGSIARLQFSSKLDEPDDSTSTLGLANQDLLVGSLTGQLKVDTAFDTLTVNAAEIKKLSHTKGSPTDVQLTTWDDTTLSGQVQQPEVTCQLKSGVTLNVPVSLIEEYNQPRPAPAAAMIDQIKKLVDELNADDWKQRDQAQQKLIGMGTVVMGTLKDMRPKQPVEVQQRIDQIINSLSGKGGKAPEKVTPPVPVPMPMIEG